MYPATAKLIDISYIEALKLYFPTSFHSRTKKNNVYTVTEVSVAHSSIRL